MADPRSCLVLGGREPLAKLEEPIGYALDVLELTRLPLPGVEEVANAIRHADVILAEVSRPSPSIMFELGMALSLGVPTVHVAKEGGRVPPVLDRVVLYREGESPARLGFVIAKALEDVLSGRSLEVTVDSYQPHEYAPGHRFLALVVHVAHDKGYVLATQLQRRPVLVPFSRLIEGALVDHDGRVLREGDLLQIEVADVDGDRVVAFETDSPLPARLPADIAHAQLVLRACALIEQPRGRALEWAAIHPSAVKRLRQIRARVTHADPIDIGELADAAALAEELLSTVFAEPSADDGVRALLVARLADLERALVSLVHLAGLPIPRERQGLRSLAVAADRAGVIPPEARDLIGALSVVRSELVHGRGRVTQARVETAMQVVDLAMLSVDAAANRARQERTLER